MATSTLALWVLLVVFLGAFLAQVATRVRLIAAGAGSFSFDHPAFRIKRFIVDVLLQRQTIRERPAAGAAHALVFWGFVAFAGYTAVEFAYGLGIVSRKAEFHRPVRALAMRANHERRVGDFSLRQFDVLAATEDAAREDVLPLFEWSHDDSFLGFGSYFPYFASMIRSRSSSEISAQKNRTIT